MYQSVREALRYANIYDEAFERELRLHIVGAIYDRREPDPAFWAQIHHQAIAGFTPDLVPLIEYARVAGAGSLLPVELWPCWVERSGRKERKTYLAHVAALPPSPGVLWMENWGDNLSLLESLDEEDFVARQSFWVNTVELDRVELVPTWASGWEAGVNYMLEMRDYRAVSAHCQGRTDYSEICFEHGILPRPQIPDIEEDFFGNETWERRLRTVRELCVRDTD